MNPQAIRQRFAGRVHLPGEPGYDENRRSLNPSVDARPAFVVEAANATDVRTALVTARALGVPFSVQATGHGTHAANDGGVLVRTGGLATALVDPDRRVARVGGGTRWGAVLAAAAPFGLAPLSGSSPDVGVTGYTLGGGVGWLARRYGFAADSVLRAEVVTADGRTVTASADRNPDLFWALRGGGGNFGVVTALEFALYPVARVFAGAASFAADDAAATLAGYRDWAATAPDELSTAVLLRRMPDSPEVPAAVRGRRVVMLKAMYAGEADQARRLLRPLWDVAGPVLHEDMATTRYAGAAMGGTPAPYLDLFRSLPDPVLRVLAGAHEDGLASTVEIRHWGGAMAAPGPGAGPVGHRDMPFSVILDASVPAVNAALRPYGSGGSFLNFLADPGRTASAFTPVDLARLRSVKATYDPDNVFRVGHNITPDRSAGRADRPGLAM